MRYDDGDKIACSVLSISTDPDPAFPLSTVLVLVAGRPGTSVYLATDRELAPLTRAMHTQSGIYLHPEGLVESRRIEGLSVLDVTPRQEG